MQDYRIDGHKLSFHVQRVSDWLKGKIVCPIYLEIAPSGGCNHRCIFCAVDYLEYKPVFLDTEVLLQMIRQAAGLGVKSVMYAGEGEPLLHKDIDVIIYQTKRSGIDVSMTTNGVLLKKEVSRSILKDLSWIRVSLNAGTAKTYAKVHSSKEEDFGTVLDNLAEAVYVKRKYGLKVTIGAQLLLLPQNAGEAVLLARKLRNIGLDYFSVKPYSQHPLSKARIDRRFKYDDQLGLVNEFSKVSRGGFSVIFRDETMRRLNTDKDYRRCLGLPFWAYIDAKGDVYACSAFLGKKDFCYGNIYRSDFKSIINGRRRSGIIKRMESRQDVAKCRQACRLDKINSYLWELKHPGPHINFI